MLSALQELELDEHAKRLKRRIHDLERGHPPWPSFGQVKPSRNREDIVNAEKALADAIVFTGNAEAIGRITSGQGQRIRARCLMRLRLVQSKNPFWRKEWMRHEAEFRVWELSNKPRLNPARLPL